MAGAISPKVNLMNLFNLIAMSKKGYKYTLHYRLRQLSVDDCNRAKKFLPDLLKISPTTLKRWIYVHASDAFEIPGTAILKMAAFFNVKPEDMLTYPPDLKGVQNKWKEYQQRDILSEKQRIQFYETA